MATHEREARGRHLNDEHSGKHRSKSSSRSDIAVKDVEIQNRRTWRIGILNDKHTDEVPGSVLLLSHVNKYNAPLGFDDVPNRRDSHSSSTSMPSLRYALSPAMFSQRSVPEKKKTKDGKIILEPQPEESGNDPLNWPKVRRDVALVCLGFYCMLGGGMTPILAAGFTNVAETYHVSIPDVARTTGLYMLGLGIGSVIASPTAIAFGKRPVYLVGSVLFVLSSVWCALSPNYASLVIARVFMGLAVSPVECLPSATIAEIFFLHERAYRLGIYTLLLLGGKNLIPLVSAAIIQSLGWRWVFWVVAIVVGFAGILLFFFVPETFWDRAPMPHKKGHRRPSLSALRRRSRSKPAHSPTDHAQGHAVDAKDDAQLPTLDEAKTNMSGEGYRQRRARFAEVCDGNDCHDPEKALESASPDTGPQADLIMQGFDTSDSRSPRLEQLRLSPVISRAASDPSPASPTYHDDAFVYIEDSEKPQYTTHYRSQPPKTFTQTLKPYSGRLNHDNWFRVAVRPFILFAYPAILWSAAVYALSVGWLIVLSESVSTIYRSRDTYNFDAIQVGLVYISPFVGGILGTVVAGKVSDIVVRFMARKNEGVYEPEFRLVMAIPVALTTAIGLMGFGWSAQEHDSFWVPTIFFGVISFGCSLGSTTAITFAVDSYRQYAGEALVTLNFSKNIFHGLVFSLFFNSWLDSDGAKTVFVALGGIQIFFLLWTIPLYIFGKRLRMWTVRRKMMEQY